MGARRVAGSRVAADRAGRLSTGSVPVGHHRATMRRTARPLAPAIPALLALLAPLLVATCSGNAVTTSSAAPSTGSSASPVSTPLASPATPTLSLQPSSTPTTAPTEDPSPRPSGTPVAIGALRWEPLDGLPEIGYPRDLVGFAAGYLLVGEEGVFFSPDARTWTAVRLPVATSAIEHEGWSVVTDGRVAVVVGTETIPPCIGDGSAPGDTGGEIGRAHV